MGREVRMVPADWAHPTDGVKRDGSPNFKPLMRGPYSERVAEWDRDYAAWQRGMTVNFLTGEERPIGDEFCHLSFEEWDGARPVPKDYMPEWADGEATHCMMYEDTTEGTPISPAFATPEELARWLVDNNASAFGYSTASYEQWLGIARGGFAPSMVITGGKLMSGVAAFGRDASQGQPA